MHYKISIFQLVIKLGKYLNSSEFLDGMLCPLLASFGLRNKHTQKERKSEDSVTLS